MSCRRTRSDGAPSTWRSRGARAGAGAVEPGAPGRAAVGAARPARAIVVTGAEWPEPAALDAVVAALGPRCERDAPLGARTTYRVGGRAALLFHAATVDELSRAGQVAAALGVKVMVVGRGSNLLIADAGFPGLAVTLLPEAFGSISVGSDGVVRAGGAVPLPVLARQSAAEGLTGLEWAVGVPGSVGGRGQDECRRSWRRNPGVAPVVSLGRPPDRRDGSSPGGRTRIRLSNLRRTGAPCRGRR